VPPHEYLSGTPARDACTRAESARGARLDAISEHPCTPRHIQLLSRINGALEHTVGAGLGVIGLDLAQWCTRCTSSRSRLITRACATRAFGTSGEGLDFSGNAKTVRVTADGGRTVSDGQFHDAKDQFGGFWIIEAHPINDAVEWAKRVPLSVGGVEVRPILANDPADWNAEPKA
jgi:hypothetical protein